MTHFTDLIFGSRFWALFKKEVAQIRRNRQLLRQLLLPPTLFLVIFGFALNPEFHHLKVGITDYSNSPASREFTELFHQTDAFAISQYYVDDELMHADLAQGKLTVGITIPPEFDKDIARRRTAQVQALFDATDANTASVASNYFSQLVNDYNVRYSQNNSRLSQTTSSTNSTISTPNTSNSTADNFSSQPSTTGINPNPSSNSISPSNNTSSQTSQSSSPSSNATTTNTLTQGSALQNNPVQLQSTVLYNPGLETAWFIVPGIMGIVLSVIGSQAAASLVVREKESGTIEQLMMTPASNTEIILAKISPLIILLTFDALMGLVIGKLVFSLPFRGNLLLFLSIAILYFFVGISIGILIASYAKSEQQAQLITFFINPPLVLLSGSSTPITSMPTVVQWLTYLNPLRYFNEVCRALFLKGVGLESLWLQVLCLLFFAIILLTLSVLQFRHRLN